MKVLGTLKHLLLVALLVNGLALAACDSGDDGNDPIPGDDVVGQNCENNCDNRECGLGLDPTCGTSCGNCDTGMSCGPDGMCIDCTPSCGTRVCGDDGCGGSCGTCDDGTCNANGQCVVDCADDGCGTRQCGPSPNCEGYFCGDNGGQCLTGDCGADGMCVCTPDCDDVDCGDDGCGGSCGTCEDGWDCNAGTCTNPDCAVGTACFDWYDCANACPSGPSQQQCWIECDNALRPESLAAKNAFVACQTDECGYCADNECLNECISTNCSDSYQECLLTYACGDGTCSDWYACVGSCPEYDVNPEGYFACQEDCNRASSREGMLDVNAVQDCMSRECPSSLEGDAWVDCANEAINEGGGCETEAEPCFGGGSFDFCDPTTDDCLTCNEMMGCLNSCPTSDQECYNDCFSAASEAAYTEMQDVYACIDEYCGTLEDAEWETCANNAINDADQCATEAAPCFGGGDDFEFCDPTTDDCLTCTEMIGCLNSCPSGDQDCFNNCFAAASEAAYTQMQDAYACIDEYCGTLEDAEWETCANAALNDVEQCQALGAPCFGSGDVEFCDPTTETCLDCSGLVECANACADDACVQNCIASASEAAYDELQAMYACFNQYCDSDTLTEEEWSTCANTAANDADQCQAEATPCLSAAKREYDHIGNFNFKKLF